MAIDRHLSLNRLCGGEHFGMSRCHFFLSRLCGGGRVNGQEQPLTFQKHAYTASLRGPIYVKPGPAKTSSSSK